MPGATSFDRPSRQRYRFILRVQRWRRPLAVFGAVVALIGLVVTVASANGWPILPEGQARIHPTTAATLMWLGLGVARFRRDRPTSRRKYAISVMFLMLCVTHWAMYMLGLDGVLHLSGQFGHMGPDTAVSLTLLLSCLLLRRRNQRAALLLLLTAASLIVNAAIGRSYAAVQFGGHMSLATLASLMAITVAITTIFAPRPLARVVFLADDIGLRTRRMMAASVIVPWASGAVLFMAMPMTERAARLESLSIALIVILMNSITIYSGHLSYIADCARRRVERRLMSMAIEDPLTGVLNRAGLLMHLDRFWSDYTRFGRTMGAILIDVDHFKQINDSFGHDEGDRVLATLSEAMRPLLRRGDALGRWGGEEFLLLLPQTDAADLPAIAERVRQQVTVIARLIAEPGRQSGTRYATTASVGVSCFLATDSLPTEAISRADKALYAAKCAGRNCVELDPAMILHMAA